MAYRRILVPVTGSPADETAVKLACSLAKEEKEGKVFAIYVIEVKRSLPLEAMLDAEVAEGERILDRAARFADEMDYEVETELFKAREVGPAIVDAAVEKEAELVVMGIEYKKRFGEFHLGRVVPYVLRAAPCRVFLCREPAESGEEG